MPSSSPISITGAALEEVTLGFIAMGDVELVLLTYPAFSSHLFIVWKTSLSWRPVIDLSHLIRFVDVSPLQMVTIQSVLLSVSQGDWMASIDLEEAHRGCLLRQHHSSGLPSQGGWLQVSSPQLLGSGDLALDGIPLHSPSSTVPPGLQQRPRRRPVSPSPAPTFGVVSVPDRLSIFEKTLAGPNRFLCHLRQSSLFDLLLTIPGSDVSSHGRVSPVLGPSSGLRVPSGGYHSACSRDAPGLHGDGAHPSGSTLGPVPLVLGPAPAFAGSSSGPPGPS